MYVAFGHDNDLYFFDDRTDLRRCPACKHLLSKWDEDLTIVPIGKSRKYDFGCSYDGVHVGSTRFKAVYDQTGMTGLVFTPLRHNLFAVFPTPIVEYDAIRRGTRFENQCEICGNYESVVGATPVYLMPGTSVDAMGFARTNLEFATMDEKSPLFICGDEAAKILKAAKLKGLDLHKVKP